MIRFQGGGSTFVNEVHSDFAIQYPDSSTFEQESSGFLYLHGFSLISEIKSTQHVQMRLGFATLKPITRTIGLGNGYRGIDLVYHFCCAHSSVRALSFFSFARSCLRFHR